MLDTHGGGMWRNHTLLGDLTVAEENPDMESVVLEGADKGKPEMFRRLLACAGLREIWWNGRGVRKGCGAPDWFQDTLGCPAITIECSVVSYFDRHTSTTRPFTQESYGQLGRDLGAFFAAECGRVG
jgi:hypothetical protein